MAAPSDTLLSLEDYERLPDDGMMHEFHRGELISIPRPTLRHSRLASKLFTILAGYLDDKKIGDVLFGSGFQLEPDIVVGPDIAFLTADRLASAKDDEWFQGAPELAIEIVSPSNSAEQLREKISEYLGAGDQAVWVLYPQTRRVEVHRAQSIQVLGVNDELTEPDLFPGLSIPIGPLFE